MTILAVSRAFYRAQIDFVDDLDAALRVLSQQLTTVLLRFAGRDGTIPKSSEVQVLVSTGFLVERFFVGADQRSAFSADGISPMAEYPRLLNRAIAQVTADVAQAHTAILAKLPPDVGRWLKSHPYTRPAIEMLRGDRSNPLAAYSFSHTWVDTNGYQLSDRIWRTGVRTRTRIDGILSEGIRAGTSALDLSKLLEQFLLPSRKNLTTRKPYGVKASRDALTLARTEIGRAHSYASFTAALGNPFVEGWDWALSAQHPKFDICDKLATIGMDGVRLQDPYPITGRVPIPIQDSHPNCICNGRPGPLRPTKDVIADLRAMMGKGQQPPLSAADPLRWVKLLLGAFLAGLVEEWA